MKFMHVFLLSLSKEYYEQITRGNKETKRREVKHQTQCKNYVSPTWMELAIFWFRNILTIFQLRNLIHSRPKPSTMPVKESNSIYSNIHYITSSSSSSLTRFSATISKVSLFFALKTVPYVPVEVNHRYQVVIYRKTTTWPDSPNWQHSRDYTLYKLIYLHRSFQAFHTSA